MSLNLQPVDFDEACQFIKAYHRHHLPPQGYKFCVGVNDGEKIVGVAIVGRPVSRMLDDGWTLEVTRTCTDGTKNANSMLYGAAWRATKALGYRKLITYTLPEESGKSLRAAGFNVIGTTSGGSWSRNGRLRIDKHPLQAKLKWQVNV